MPLAHERSLVLRAQSGDRDAFDALLREIGPAEELPFVEERPDPWQRERLLSSLERLSPASRAVVTLHCLEEMPLTDVACAAIVVLILKRTFFGAVIFEGLFTLGIVDYIDFRNPLHMLIACCTGVIYMPVILGLVALGAYVNRAVLRVLARLDQ